MVTIFLIDHDDYQINNLLQVPKPNILTNKQPLVMGAIRVTWPVSVSSVCCFSFLLGCGHTPAVVKPRCDPDQSREPRYLTLTLMGRHYRFELSTLG